MAWEIGRRWPELLGARGRHERRHWNTAGRTKASIRQEMGRNLLLLLWPTEGRAGSGRGDVVRRCEMGQRLLDLGQFPHLLLPVICLLLLLILCRLIAAAASHSRAHHHSGNFGGRLYLRLVQRFAGHYLHFPQRIFVLQPAKAVCLRLARIRGQIVGRHTNAAHSVGQTGHSAGWPLEKSGGHVT